MDSNEIESTEMAQMQNNAVGHNPIVDSSEIQSIEMAQMQNDAVGDNPIIDSSEIQSVEMTQMPKDAVGDNSIVDSSEIQSVEMTQMPKDSVGDNPIVDSSEIQSIDMTQMPNDAVEGQEIQDNERRRRHPDWWLIDMSSELVSEAADEASENELLERSLSVWKGCNSVEWDDFAPTPLDLHTACSIGQYDWVHSIILKGEDTALDRRNHGGWTPLMYASYIGHDSIVNLLISAGCNMNLKNSRGHTPLMLAASCGNESVARTLVRRGAKLELTDKTGWTALFHATYAGHQNFVAFLLEAGANKDALEPSSGTTPFMEAVAEGHEIIVQIYLQHAVNINAKAYNGDMARSLALINGHMKIVSIIDDHAKSLSCLRPQSGPSIRDGPEAIARMIDRTQNTETVPYSNLLVPKGYVTFPLHGIDEETRMSYRDVTSPITPEDYKDSSGSRAMSDLEDFNDDSNAFTMTGAITIKSSSSSSGGLAAALGLSREGSLDSDNSHSFEQAATSSGDVAEFPEITFESNEVKVVTSSEEIVSLDANPNHRGGSLTSHVSGKENLISDSNLVQRAPVNTVNSENICSSSDQNVLVASPLIDYFPSHSPFPVDTATPPEPPEVLQHESSLPSSSHSTLPKDNMSQVEIVNRFLRNLTVNNPETSAGQYRWADETSGKQSCGYLDGVPHQMENLRTTSEVIPEIGRCSLSGDVDGVLNEESARGKSSLPTRDTTVPQAEFVEGLPGLSSKDKSSTNIQGHQFLRSNPEHQKDPFEQISNQPWAHHPQLNHHHPLHNRHLLNRSPLSHHHSDSPDGNVRHTPRLNIAHPPSSQLSLINPTEIPETFLHDLPQEYFYSDIETASHVPQEVFEGTSSAAALSASTPPDNTAAVASGNLFPPPPQTAAMQSTSQDSVIIPGHTTSQPVCTTIDWDQGGLMDSLGPQDLSEMFSQLGLTKYLEKFEEQDVDLQVFLSMTDNDLRQLGVKLFGPRKKMTNAIARWHSNAPIANNSLEQTYADKLEGEMQEMAIQLKQAYESAERLKAQVSQEQQLRAVTESCLMEERAAWEQGREIVLNTKTKLCTMGDLMSRLRLHQKELRKHLEQVSRQLSVREPDDPPHSTGAGGKTVENLETDKKVLTLASSMSATSSELLKQSEQCLKEMHETLSDLVISAEDLLKCTHNVGNTDEDRT